MAIGLQKHGHNLQHISTLVQPEYCQDSISTRGSYIAREGRTVGQLFDTQSTHLLAVALPEAAVGQVFLHGLVSRVDLNITSAPPNVPYFPASGESGLPLSLRSQVALRKPLGLVRGGGPWKPVSLPQYEDDYELTHSVERLVVHSAGPRHIQ